MKLRSTRSRRFSLSLAFATLIVACGGDPAAEEPPVTTVVAETSTTTEEPAATISEQTESGDQGTGSDCSLEAPASCGGSATLTLAGETVVFDFFACFFGDEAAAAVGSDGATFVALGQVSQSGGTASVGANTIGRGLHTHEVFYVPGGNSGPQWHGVDATDLLEIEGSQVTFEGNFVEVVDGAATGQSVAGSLDATCG